MIPMGRNNDMNRERVYFDRQVDFTRQVWG